MHINLPTPKTLTMSELLNNNMFTIPNYQREYSWDIPEAMDLLHDIKQVVYNRENAHFFGSIVTLPSDLNNRNAPYLIIDGQQRISTSIVLVSVIRRLTIKALREIPQKEKSIGGNNIIFYLHFLKHDTKGVLFKGNNSLTLNVQRSDDSKEAKQNYSGYFNYLITNANNGNTYNLNYEPIKLLRRVYSKIYRVLNCEMKKLNNKDKVIYLKDLFSSFMKKFYVVVINAPTREDAITIYMTLNNRGKDLSTADIVKSQLAGTMSDNKIDNSHIMFEWGQMTRVLNDDSKVISNFIREYWSTCHHVVSDKELARDVIHQINTPQSANQMIKDLLQLVNVYKTLNNPSSNRDTHIFQSKSVIHIISILNAMKLTQYYPLVLAMYHGHYSDEQMNKIIQIIKKIEMRRLPFKSNHAHYDIIANKIWHGQLESIDDIIQEIINRKLLFNSEDTRRMCISYQHKGAKQGKGVNIILYMLSGIYSQHGDFDNGHSLYQKIFLEKDYRIVHIANENIDNNYRDYMGNWTILELPLYNQLNRNRNINNLIHILMKSNLKCNHSLATQIAQCHEQGNNLNYLILQRQKQFANDYIKAW